VDTATETVWTRTGRHCGNQLNMRSVVLRGRRCLSDVDVHALSMFGLISFMVREPQARAAASPVKDFYWLRGNTAGRYSNNQN